MESRHAQLRQDHFIQTSQRKWKAGPRARLHAGRQVLTCYSRRRHTAKYSIQAPYVFDKIIRLSNAKHGPIKITSVNAESTHSDVHIQIQTVKSVAGRDNVRSYQLKGMPACTARARSLYTDIAARMEGRTTSTSACWLPSTHIL